MKKMFKKSSLSFIGFLQASGIFMYCLLVGLLLWKGNDLFGNINNLLGPLMVLSLLVVSVLICALLAFGKAAILFWDNKDTEGAVRLVAFTAAWLALFVIFLINVLIYKNFSYLTVITYNAALPIT